MLPSAVNGTSERPGAQARGLLSPRTPPPLCSCHLNPGAFSLATGLQSLPLPPASPLPQHRPAICPLNAAFWTSLVVQIKNPPANSEDMGLIPGSGRFHLLWSNYPHDPWGEV